MEGMEVIMRAVDKSQLIEMTKATKTEEAVKKGIYLHYL